MKPHGISSGIRWCEVQKNCMASNIPKPTPDDYLIAEDSPRWLSTPSPFDTLDNEWYQIIIFYVFHVPVSGVSARAKPLDSYGWGVKSGNADFKLLKKRLIKYSSIKETLFRCEDVWAHLKQAFQVTNLSDFPTDITRERVKQNLAKVTVYYLISEIRSHMEDCHFTRMARMYILPWKI